jgi:hypothetical protein
LFAALRAHATHSLFCCRRVHGARFCDACVRSAGTGARENGADTAAGFDVGAGIEYFFRRRTTFTGETLYHRVGAFNTPVTIFNEGSFWPIDVGLKAYIKHQRGPFPDWRPFIH